MSWLDFFQTTQSLCDISFGRGINATVSSQEEELFNNSASAFENKEVVNAYEYFLQSLINFQNEVSNENITLKRVDDTLVFELFQGTAKINGRVTHKNLYAEVTMVKSKDASVALKRYVLERNYQLTYVNYFSDGAFIKLKLYQDNLNLSPQKIFFPLRELALNADYDKEHIKSEFPEVLLEDIAHLQMPEKMQIEVKHKYLLQWIQELEEKILTLPSNDTTGMQSFFYLNLFFKIDYLISAKFTISQKISKRVQDYFSNENATVEAKNEVLKKYLLKLKNMDFDTFTESFYDAKYTYNSIEKSPYKDIVIFIDESQNKIQWYKKNRYTQVIPTIYKYIAFYSLYNYGMNPTLKALFHLLVEIQNAPYFEALGCNPLYNETAKTFAKRAIVTQMKKIAMHASNKYKAFTINIDDLNFSSMNEFNYSYYNMLKNLDFEEV